jgi:hypothetical protein
MLSSFLSEVTDRVIAQGIHSDSAEVEVAPEQIPLDSGRTRSFEAGG